VSYERSTIGQREVSHFFTEPLAWKRSGFKDREALEQAVRDLPIEKQVAMLVEIKMPELATMLWNEKQNFLLNLGHKTWVDGYEMHKYAVDTYTDKEWIINDVICFQPEAVVSGVSVRQINGTHVDRLREQRNGNENKDM
jgi:hypothetical protein